MAASLKSRTGSRHKPEQTREAILDAAMREFALEGVAGARTEAIARAAKVNKALLYYYFKDKEALFGAVMDRVFTELTSSIDAAIKSDLPPKDKFLAYVRAHFDFVARDDEVRTEWFATSEAHRRTASAADVREDRGPYRRRHRVGRFPPRESGTFHSLRYRSDRFLLQHAGTQDDHRHGPIRAEHD
jgi:AcrR family transcriptional regulator